MVNVEAARRELDGIEAFLRTRYHYPHPIFEHVAAAKANLEPDEESEAEIPEEPAIAEAPETAEDASAEEPANAPAEAPEPPPEPKRRTSGGTRQATAKR